MLAPAAASGGDDIDLQLLRPLALETAGVALSDGHDHEHACVVRQDVVLSCMSSVSTLKPELNIATLIRFVECPRPAEVCWVTSNGNALCLLESRSSVCHPVLAGTFGDKAVRQRGLALLLANRVRIAFCVQFLLSVQELNCDNVIPLMGSIKRWGTVTSHARVSNLVGAGGTKEVLSNSNFARCLLLLRPLLQSFVWRDPLSNRYIHRRFCAK